MARNRDLAGVTAAPAQALALARHLCSRVWVVRTHLLAPEQTAWRVALRRQKITLVRVGRHGLGVIPVDGFWVPVSLAVSRRV